MSKQTQQQQTPKSQKRRRRRTSTSLEKTLTKICTDFKKKKVVGWGRASTVETDLLLLMPICTNSWRLVEILDWEGPIDVGVISIPTVALAIEVVEVVAEEIEVEDNTNGSLGIFVGLWLSVSVSLIVWEPDRWFVDVFGSLENKRKRK